MRVDLGWFTGRGGVVKDAGCWVSLGDECGIGLEGLAGLVFRRKEEEKNAEFRQRKKEIGPGSHTL